MSAIAFRLLPKMVGVRRVLFFERRQVVETRDPILQYKNFPAQRACSSAVLTLAARTATAEQACPTASFSVRGGVDAVSLVMKKPRGRGVRDRAVYKAIDLAKEGTVRTVLKLLYSGTPNVKGMVEDALLAVEENGNDKGEVNEEVTAKKRKQPVRGAASGNKRVLGVLDRAVSKAIDLADAETVRTVLKNVYADTPNVKQMVEDAFLPVAESDGEGSGDGKSGVNEEVTAKKRRYTVREAVSGNKRVRPRYLVCKQCEKKFDVTKNHDKACVWHKGDLELNYEDPTWDDWDGPPPDDTEETREEFPEGFWWTCCKEDRDAECCMRTAQEADGLRIIVCYSRSCLR